MLAVIVSLAVATGWLCRSRCQPRSYTGMGTPVLWTAHFCVVGVWGRLSQDVYKL